MQDIIEEARRAAGMIQTTLSRRGNRRPEANQAPGVNEPGENQQSGAGQALAVNRPLDAHQQTALELLLEGKSITETARSAQVSRETIYQWMKHDPDFQAAYNRWHDQLRESCESRLLLLTDKATNALEKALEAGDARSALQLLKGMGMIRQRVIGPTEPEEAKKRIGIEKARKREMLMLDEMIVGGGEG